MVFKVIMPRIDANVEEGTIGRWIEQVGRRVEPGTPLVEIITDKATFELEAEQAGVLRQRVMPEKSVVPVGCVIALLSETEDEPLPDVSGENDEIMRQHRDSMLLGLAGSEQAAPEPAQARPTQDKVWATPAARKLARREGIRLEDLTPAQGRIIQHSDVAKYLQQSSKGSGRTAGGEKGAGDAR